jgi:D-alanyl-D-alanine carboxypeptidase
MKNKTISAKISETFRKQVKQDSKIKNAYLLVHSEPLGIDLKVAEGSTDGQPANIDQPNYMASVGKIFTSTLVSMFYEMGKLDFEDKINKYLDPDIILGLHIYKGRDYSNEIRIRHLLNQTSGLCDSFWNLLQMFLKDPDFTTTPINAIKWGKENMKSHFPPGTKHFYSDTNYYLLGLILERISNKPFHELLSKYIFDPLDMNSSYMLGYSVPSIESTLPLAGFYAKGVDLSKVHGYPGLDYSGGGIVSIFQEYLVFMRALVENRILKKETIQKMIADKDSFNLSISYGYGIWMFKSIPLLLPESYYCWGCAGATGAFMFYHPKTSSYIIGNFNDLSYKSKALQFMLFKIIKQLLKGEST